MVFRKNLRSLERRWEKISKFLGDLPSEQIFYRNIPLGALGYFLYLLTKSSYSLSIVVYAFALIFTP